jgi:hypothetical protein
MGFALCAQEAEAGGSGIRFQGDAVPLVIDLATRVVGEDMYVADGRVGWETH